MLKCICDNQAKENKFEQADKSASRNCTEGKKYYLLVSEYKSEVEILKAFCTYDYEIPKGQFEEYEGRYTVRKIK